MKLEGGCYCGQVRYTAEGEPMVKGQCYCRECQYITGGAPHTYLLMRPEGFIYTRGEPRQFARGDLESPVTREFCATCGTHILTRRPGVRAVILKAARLMTRAFLTVHKWPSSRSTNSPSIKFPTDFGPTSAYLHRANSQ